jgi:hypothetical protein
LSSRGSHATLPIKPAELLGASCPAGWRRGTIRADGWWPGRLTGNSLTSPAVRRKWGATEQADAADEALGGTMARTEVPPRARAVAHGRGHRFAADPPCSVDAGWSTPPRVSSAGTAVGSRIDPGGVFTGCRVTRLQAVSRLRTAPSSVPRLGLAGHGGQGSRGWGARGCRGGGHPGSHATWPGKPAEHHGASCLAGRGGSTIRAVGWRADRVTGT